MMQNLTDAETYQNGKFYKNLNTSSYFTPIGDVLTKVVDIHLEAMAQGVYVTDDLLWRSRNLNIEEIRDFIKEERRLLDEQIKRSA